MESRAWDFPSGICKGCRQINCVCVTVKHKHIREKCRHGYIKSQCRCIASRTDVIVPCTDVPNCPVVAVEDDDVRYPVLLTRDEMRFIRGAMAGMGALPIAQSVRDAMNEGETAATIARTGICPKCSRSLSTHFGYCPMDM